MHPRISVHGVCFLGNSLKEQAAHWRHLGVQRTTLIGLQIESEGVEEARRALDVGECEAESIVHSFLVGQHLNTDKNSWGEARRRLSAQIEAACELGARSIYMTTGGHGALQWEEAAQVFAEAVAPCVEQARSAGIALMIENAPALYADIHLAHTLRDTLVLAEMADVGVCIDVFGCWMEAGLNDLIAEAMPRCGLVQISDYVYGDRSMPCRAVPGDGDIPLDKFLSQVLAAGYQGVFDLEMLGPRIDEEGAASAVQRAGQWLGERLPRD